MSIDKQISIRCGGEKFIDIEELHFFQKKLKSIDKDNFYKLKESLKQDGLPLGFHIWLNPKTQKNDIMDGHHRWLALKELREEGWFVPPVPCSFVKAETRKEAAKVVLISNSRYAKISEESLSDFMIDFELGVDDLELLDFADLDLHQFDHDEDEFTELDDEIPEDVKKNYSDKISTPIYSPKLDEAPEISELINTEKYETLIDEVNNKDLPEEIKLFLIHSATRHIVFNYENIAEFYCHQNKDVQDLMEKSALVIIDFKKAVENGFVKLTEDLNNIYQKQDVEDE